MADEARCENCRYWKAFDDPPAGLCKRFPPALASFRKKGTLYIRPDDWSQPVLHKDDWCGEHRPKAEG